MSLQYDLFDIVAVAIMSDPVVIVEGKDDYQIYQNLSQLLKKQIDVYQVNQFENYAEGCKGVIDCIEILQPKFDEREDIIKKILGIIDRDSRPYRNEIPSHLKGLFITRYYSIETYFANNSTLSRVINKITYTTNKDIREDVLQLINNEFDNFTEELYWISLEALKNACIKSYTGIVGYDFTEAKVTSVDSKTHILSQIIPKKEELTVFANEKNVSKEDIKLIAKGKWYLYGYAYVSNKIFSTLKEKCRNSSIHQCSSCAVGNFNDCLFNTKRRTYKAEEIRDSLLEYFDLNECADIVEAINKLN